MRFFGNDEKTYVATDSLDRVFLVQAPHFTTKGIFQEIPQAFSWVYLEDAKELDFAVCVDLEIPKEVLEVVG